MSIPHYVLSAMGFKVISAKCELMIKIDVEK